MKKKDKKNKIINVEVNPEAFERLKIVQGFLAFNSKPSTQNDAIEYLLNEFNPNKK